MIGHFGTSFVRHFSAYVLGQVMWEGLYCFLLFSCGDWAGRLLAGALAGCGARFFESGAILKLLILSRLVFLPLFMLCNHEHTRWPIVFAHDVFPIGFMVLFSISNGATQPCLLPAWLWVDERSAAV